MGFDSATHEGVHINLIHYTTEKDCCGASVHELPGGMATDYSNHICDTVDHLSELYIQLSQCSRDKKENRWEYSQFNE